MEAATQQVVTGVTMTYQEVMQRFIWNAFEFATYLAIITYVLDHFGWIRAAPEIQGNVIEVADEGFKGFGSFLKEGIKEGTRLAKTINSAVSESKLEDVVPVSAKASTPKKK